jgi:cytosine/adenosine deaminase-related metal-dependent hydrolase
MDVPFHIHIEEQRREIHECTGAYAVGPLRLMLRQLPIGRHFTAIHCTHSSPDDLRELVSRGGRICVCPSTEGNLADGVPLVPEIRQSGGKLCIGSDCNLRIAMTEDLRWLEFAQRLANERSGIVVDGVGQVAPALFELATVNGAQSLHLQSGSVAPGNHADLIAIDLNHPSLLGATAESLLHAFIFGCGNEPIQQVWVGGQPVI